MKKFSLFIGIGVGIIAGMAIVGYFLMPNNDRSLSPEDVISFHGDGLSIEVYYNRPQKRGREIFGGLVPYNEVWRTGANEATTFSTNKRLKIKDQILNPGKYSLWTIPQKDIWTIIFNSEYGQWGINSKGEANRNPDLDVLRVDAKAAEQETEFEQFTIAFKKLDGDVEMVFLWDKTVVSLPMTVLPNANE